MTSHKPTAKELMGVLSEFPDEAMSVDKVFEEEFYLKIELNYEKILAIIELAQEKRQKKL